MLESDRLILLRFKRKMKRRRRKFNKYIRSLDNFINDTNTFINNFRSHEESDNNKIIIERILTINENDNTNL